MVTNSIIAISPLPFNSDCIFETLDNDALSDHLKDIKSKIGKRHIIIIHGAEQVAKALRDSGFEYTVLTPTHRDESYGKNPLTMRRDLS